MKKMNRFCGCSRMLPVVVLLLMLSGCRTEYVPVETVVKEHHYHNDTVRQTDTVRSEKKTVIREANAGDSLMLAEMGIKLKENERLLILLQRELEKEKSTSYQHSTDTAYVEKEVKVPYPVERKLNKWKQAKMDYGAVAIGVSLAAIAAAVVFIVIRIRKKIPV